MEFTKIGVRCSSGVAELRLSDPDRLNAISGQLLDEVNTALDKFIADGEVRVMLLSAEGRSFCSGIDLSGDLAVLPKGSDGEPDAGAALEKFFNPLMLRLRNLPFTWISAVQGPAAGIGCSIALAADMIVAAESAYFLQAFVNLGLVPDGGSAWLLGRGASRCRAMEMMLLGERLPAATAQAWGLINRVVPDDSLNEAANALARRLASGPAQTLGLIRELAWRSTEVGFEQSLHEERIMQRAAGKSMEFMEGIQSFRQKRAPVFQLNTDSL